MSTTFEAMEGLSWELPPYEERALPSVPETKGAPPPISDASVHAEPSGARVVITRRNTRITLRWGRILGAIAFLIVLGMSAWVGVNEGRNHPPVAPDVHVAGISYTPPPGAKPTQEDEAPAFAPPPMPVSAAAPRPAPPPASPAFTFERTAPHGTQQAAQLFRHGNDLAAQGRWEEASAAYAGAFTLHRRSVHAFNLAVSLEHLNRREEALHYYRAALAAREDTPDFDARMVRQRIILLAQENTR